MYRLLQLSARDNRLSSTARLTNANDISSNFRCRPVCQPLRHYVLISDADCPTSLQPLSLTSRVVGASVEEQRQLIVYAGKHRLPGLQGLNYSCLRSFHSALLWQNVRTHCCCVPSRPCPIGAERCSISHRSINQSTNQQTGLIVKNCNPLVRNTHCIQSCNSAAICK